MFKFSLISLFSLILINQNILLLNEESLILICFVTFCWITFNKLSSFITEDLTNRSKSIEQSLIYSLNQLLKILINAIEVQNKFQSLSSKFQSLGNHFFKLSSAIYNELPIYFVYKSEIIYPKKLVFTQRMEEQTTKLVALLLSQKLVKLVSIKNFYSTKIKVINLLCINKIILHEMFEKI